MTTLQLQRALNLLGANPKLKEDGLKGSKTLMALSNFQRSHGLVDDGLLGPKTIAKIEQELNKVINTSPAIPVQDDKPVDIEIRDFKVSAPRIARLHPKIRNLVYNTIVHIEQDLFEDERIAIRVVQGLRTFAEQDALYRQRPKVTNARGGQSIHNYGLAFDFAILYDVNGDGKFEELSWDTRKDFDRDGVADWLEVVRAFKNQGFEWGGEWDFVDNPHLQKTFQFNGRYQPMLDLYNKGKVDKDGYIIF